MKKIEKAKQCEPMSSMEYELFDKINEIIKVVNAIDDHLFGAPKTPVQEAWISSGMSHLNDEEDELMGEVPRKQDCEHEKPAKKECEPLTARRDGNKSVVLSSIRKKEQDELARRLDKFLWSKDFTSEEVADEARKWAVEVVEKAFRDSDNNYEGVLLDEVLERLKGV